jgi:type II secretory pathway predicted ATPase ExeA
MEPARAPLDPFGLTPDTAAYVPRPATERALEELLAAVRSGPEPVALLGPAGVGKTLLLHLLAERAGPAFRSIYLPNPKLDPEELCTWVVRGLGAPADEDPVRLLRAAAAHLREQEQACLLLVDDADALGAVTAAWLGRFAREAGGGLRVALAAADVPGARRALAAIGATQVVRLDTPMSIDETREYLAWRLRNAGAPAATQERIGGANVADLYRVAGGNPRRLHLAVAALLRGGHAELVEDDLDQQAARAALALATPPRTPRAAPSPAPDVRPRPPAREAPSRRGRGALLVAVGLAAVAALFALAQLGRG